MTVRCTEYGGQELQDATLQSGPDGQEVLEYVCASSGCDDHGRIVYDNTTSQGERRLEGNIEEVGR